MSPGTAPDATEADATEPDTTGLDTTGPDAAGPDTTATNGTGAPGTADRVDVTALRRAARTPVAIGLLVLVGALVVGLLTGAPARGWLDPAATDDSGSRAVVRLLEGGGVTVREAGRAAELPTGAATVLVPAPERLGLAQLAALRDSSADVVLVAPGPAALAELAPGVELVDRGASVEVREPACALPGAVRAGAVRIGGSGFRAMPPDPAAPAPAAPVVGCYPAPVEPGAGPGSGPDSGDPPPVALVSVEVGGRTVTALGSAESLYNRYLGEDGNAALALDLLGGQPELVWFRPLPEAPPDGGDRSAMELLDPGWLWGAAQLAVAVLLLAVWRARRLGPVVVEPLPVVVRGAETTEGRARLYRRAGARGHAAQVLRGAARARLAALAGLPSPDDRAALVAAVADRIDRPAVEVDAALFGPAPTDDPALVALARTLDRYRDQVRRS